MSFQSSSEFKREVEEKLLRVMQIFQSSSEFKIGNLLGQGEMMLDTFNPLLSLREIALYSSQSDAEVFQSSSEFKKLRLKHCNQV